MRVPAAALCVVVTPLLDWPRRTLCSLLCFERPPPMFALFFCWRPGSYLAGSPRHVDAVQKTLSIMSQRRLQSAAINDDAWGTVREGAPPAQRAELGGASRGPAIHRYRSTRQETGRAGLPHPLHTTTSSRYCCDPGGRSQNPCSIINDASWCISVVAWTTAHPRRRRPTTSRMGSAGKESTGSQSNQR